jgi:FAD/FMN-containing dehydrogenase
LYKRRVKLSLVALVVACSSTPPAAPTPLPRAALCTAHEPCWPTASEWSALRDQVHGHLQTEQPAPVSTNPFALEDAPAATQSRGWLDAWTPAASPYIVAAETPSDVAAAVTFARTHHLRLVVKGTGHDYLGRSSAPDSLMIWTHAMRAIAVDDAFVPQGCHVPALPAVTVGAGARWSEAYQEVSIVHRRYVQGGGCTSVGVAGGFLQGGGYGSWSRKFGVAAASLLEAEVVTADGEIRIANACQNSDLFWALRGGGGGTFGVVTKVTLATYPLPASFGIVAGTIESPTPQAFRALVGEVMMFYRDQLANEHWGEHIELEGQKLTFSLAFEGLDQAQAEAAWAPLRAWLAQHPEQVAKFVVRAMPAELMWNAAMLHVVAPDAIRLDDHPDAPATQFWWAGDGFQVGAYWYAYQSRWIPQHLLGGDALADALVEAAQKWSLQLHFNKALGGAAPEAIARSKETSVNPAVFDASALVIIGALTGATPDPTKGAEQRDAVAAAMAPIKKLTPAASYVNETDYFEPDWQHSFWGTNYARLLSIKHAVDPTNLFVCHHCVGSE